MDRRGRAEKSLLVLLLLSSCLLVSSVPVTRSLRLPLGLTTKLTSSQETTTIGAAATNLGKPEARVDVEVNDYAMPGANDDHDPGH